MRELSDLELEAVVAGKAPLATKAMTGTRVLTPLKTALSSGCVGGVCAPKK